MRVNQTSLQTLRQALKNDMPKWADYMPVHLRDYAFKEASQAFKSAMQNLKRHKRKFNLKYKSKIKAYKETIAIEKCFINMKNNSLFPGCMKKQGVDSVIRSNVAFSTIKNAKDGYLTYNRVLKTWILNISYENSKSRKPSHEEYSDICSIDPGERDFITGYATNRNHRRRQGLRRKLHRQIKRLIDLKDELHWKTINFLCTNYKTIILPKFGVSGVVCNLNKRVSRNLMKLSHYKFRTRLIDKAREYGCKVVICTEEYTSKCCTNCGKIKKDLGSSKVYNCNHCGIVIDRDVGAARSILLKVLTELS